MYNLDTAYLAKLDTENKAYMMGFLYAKASKKDRVKVYVRSTDDYILEFIKKELKYSGPLYRTSCTGNRRPQTCLSINRKIFAEQLSKFRPDFNFSLLNHFIRGVFDGKGYIIIKKKYLNINLTFNEDFLQNLRPHLLDRHGIETKHYYRYDYTNTMSMMITKTDHSIKFLNWIYQGSSVYLTRKKDIFDNFIEDVYNKVDSGLIKYKGM